MHLQHRYDIPIMIFDDRTTFNTTKTFALRLVITVESNQITFSTGLRFNSTVDHLRDTNVFYCTALCQS